LDWTYNQKFGSSFFFSVFSFTPSSVSLYHHNIISLQILFLLLLEFLVLFFHPRFLGFRFTLVFRLSTVTRLFFSQPHFLDFLLLLFPRRCHFVYSLHYPRISEFGCSTWIVVFSEIGLEKSVEDFGIYLFRNSLGLSWGRNCVLFFAVIFFCDSWICFFRIWNGYLLFLVEVWGLFFSRGFMNIFWL